MLLHVAVFICHYVYCTAPLSRGKIQDLNTEIAQMTQEIDTYTQESATYLTFEKRCVKLHSCVHLSASISHNTMYMYFNCHINMYMYIYVLPKHVHVLLRLQ